VRSLLALLAILVLVAPTMALEEPRFTYRSYGYVVVEEGWVIEVRVGFWEPLVPGRVARVDVAFEVMEAVEGSTISIVSVTVSTGSVNTSSYVGVFRKAGDRRSLSLSLELSEPRYTRLRPGDHVIELLSLTIKGYIENGNGRSFFSRNLQIPAILASTPGALRLFIDVPANVRVGTNIPLYVVLSNKGANTIYHVSVSLYVNETLLDVIYYHSLEPGSTRHVNMQFKPSKGGAYVLTAKAKYITQEYGTLNLTYQALVYAKTQHQISIAPAPTSGGAQIVGVVSPPTDTKIYVEVSLDGLNWAPATIVTAGGDGMFVTPVTVEGRYMILRARIPETEKTFESISNIVVLEDITQARVNPPVEVRTVTHTVTQTMVQTVQAPALPNQTPGEGFELPTQNVSLPLVAAILMVGVVVGSVLLILFRRR
jgi:CARDB.